MKKIEVSKSKYISGELDISVMLLATLLVIDNTSFYFQEVMEPTLLTSLVTKLFFVSQNLNRLIDILWKYIS